MANLATAFLQEKGTLAGLMVRAYSSLALQTPCTGWVAGYSLTGSGNTLCSQFFCCCPMSVLHHAVIQTVHF